MQNELVVAVVFTVKHKPLLQQLQLVNKEHEKDKGHTNETQEKKKEEDNEQGGMEEEKEEGEDAEEGEEGKQKDERAHIERKPRNGSNDRLTQIQARRQKQMRQRKRATGTQTKKDRRFEEPATTQNKMKRNHQQRTNT